MNPYERLANAIIEMAAKDYRTALMYHFNYPGRKLYSEKVSDIERFFRSEWFCALTDLDGDYLLVRIREIALEEARV